MHKSVEERVLDRIVSRLGDIVPGNALDAATTFGPLVSERQMNRVLGYFDTAAADGAELVCGGGRFDGMGEGFYVKPTVYRAVQPSARIAQEEIFGPVLSVTTFETVEEAVRLANSTNYGLAAYVWTSNLSAGLRTAKGIRASVFLNTTIPKGEGGGHALSFEPMRQSGFGVEGGLAGVAHYAHRQALWINHD
ncbi:hypothetical protein BV908_21355 [Diaphorobacter sp. LR2014-1]|nr:hypothetical protein BV908_21355 [Diaphorobacter sp. LR2014-1]